MRLEKAIAREKKLLADLKGARAREEQLRDEARQARLHEEQLVGEIAKARKEAQRLSSAARDQAEVLTGELKALERAKTLEQAKAEALARAVRA